jgi:hypothetical protein
MTQYALKFVAILSLTMTAIAPTHASPTLSTSATIEMTSFQTITNNDPVVSRARLQQGAPTDEDIAFAGGAVSSNYNVIVGTETDRTGFYARATAGWKETFTNSSADTLLYSFTYRINPVDVRILYPTAADYAAATGITSLGFKSNLKVTKGGSTAENLIARDFATAKESGRDALILSSSSTGGPLASEQALTTGSYVAGEVVPNRFALAWDTTYITVEIGAIAAGESFTLDYLMEALTQTVFGGSCTDGSIGVRFSSTCQSLFGMFDLFVDDAGNVLSLETPDPRVGLFSRRFDAAVPEPTSTALIAFGLIALANTRRRKR